MGLYGKQGIKNENFLIQNLMKGNWESVRYMLSLQQRLDENDHWLDRTIIYYFAKWILVAYWMFGSLKYTELMMNFSRWFWTSLRTALMYIFGRQDKPVEQ